MGRRRSFRRPRLCGAAILLPALLLWSPKPNAASAGQKREFGAEAELVDGYVSVTDKTGSTVRGLTRENFRVFEDGVEQRVTHFSADDEPYTVGLVLDRSGSMTGVLEDVFDAALHTLQASKDDDEAFVIVFDERVDLVQDFTLDRKALKRALGKVRPGGETALYDAAREGLAYTRGARHRKKALLLVTDGADNKSRTSFEELLRFAGGQPVIVYLIAFFAPPMRARPEATLEVDRLVRLAAASGGKAYFPESMEACKQACLDIAKDLRHQYRLAYVPPEAEGDGTWRAIRVELVGLPRERAAEITVRARTGYYRARRWGKRVSRTALRTTEIEHSVEVSDEALDPCCCAGAGPSGDVCAANLRALRGRPPAPTVARSSPSGRAR